VKNSVALICFRDIKGLCGGVFTLDRFFRLRRREIVLVMRGEWIQSALKARQPLS
jgi:hypothetical protein